MKTFSRVLVLGLFLSAVCFSATPYVREIKKSPDEAGCILFGSWNAENFGKSKTPKAISYMAKAMRNADVFVLLEVSTSEFGAQAAGKLADALNRTGAKWDYKVSDPTHKSSSIECCAFFWKTSRIKLVSQVLPVRDLASGMEREPVEAKFKIDNWHEVTFAAVHLVPTDKHPKNEIAFLSEHSEDFSDTRFVLSGDFNLSAKEIGLPFEGKLNVQHWIEGKTSLRSKIGPKGERLANEYDNIFARGIEVRRAAILDFSKDFKTLREARTISDHLPVFIIIGL